MLQLSFGITASYSLQRARSAERRVRTSLNGRLFQAAKQESPFNVDVPELFSHQDEFGDRTSAHFVHHARAVDLDRNFGYS